MGTVKKFDLPSFLTREFRYRISSYSFRANYSFLNLTLCTVTFGYSTYMRGNYSREETIRGNTVVVPAIRKGLTNYM